MRREAWRCRPCVRLAASAPASRLTQLRPCPAWLPPGRLRFSLRQHAPSSGPGASPRQALSRCTPHDTGSSQTANNEAGAHAWQAQQLLRRCFARAWIQALHQATASRQQQQPALHRKQQHQPQPNHAQHPHPRLVAATSSLQGALLLAHAPTPHAWRLMEQRTAAAAAAAACTAASDAVGETASAARQHLLRHHLQPHMAPAPQLPADAGDRRCCLVGAAQCHRFLSPSISSWAQGLFHTIQEATHSQEGLAKVQLNQYDLFHAHIFLTHPHPHPPPPLGEQLQPGHQTWSTQHKAQGPDCQWPVGGQSQQLGVLFHCKEYPRYCEDSFPYALGYCQAGSHVPANPRCMDQRNILWFQDCLYVLDAAPGGLLHHQLLWPGQEPLRTIHESDLGLPVADLTYLPAWGEVLVTV